MKTREDLIEVMAEAYSALPECSVSTAMEAILTAMEAAGAVVVPKVATGEMAKQYEEWSGDGFCENAYERMLSASPYR